ncbi:ATP-binding protein [Phenylobacterium sp.]|jgi:signal transduction histidine kinase/CheY-like chemotaxis protein|uniref:ATP-binding protein n=1 Tax=Phenylobacterium sp. TaxID=1871053 RepID=UPI002F948387
MPDGDKSRLNLSPTVQPGRADVFSSYQLTLDALTFPAWRHALVGAVRAGCLALIGHPWLALAWFVASVPADIGQQWLVARLKRKAVARNVTDTPFAVAVLCFFRSCLYISAPLAAALISGSLEAVLFMALIGASLVALSLSYGAFSFAVFLGTAGPALVALAAVGVALLAPLHSGVIVATVVMTALVMSLVAFTWRTSLGAWRSTHNASLDLIRDLEVARDRAQEERASADIARETARRAGQARAAFLHNLSHEIRTPMNGVVGMAEALRRSAKDPEQAARLDMLVESGEHLMSILNDVLDMSKIDAGRLELVLEPEDLPRFLQMVVAFWAPQAEAKGLRLELAADTGLPGVVQMDALRLRQVLYNLISNALQYTDSGSVSVVARAGPVRQGRSRVTISVNDTGRGISPEELPTIFDRYSKGDTAAQDRYGGMGLGLAISKQVTELMGGRLKVESTPGQGSSFQVELVLELARSAELAQARKPARPAARSRRLKILAVDDDPVNLSVVEQLLVGARHQVFRAASAAEALQLAQSQAFDLLLLDVHMPQMSGPAVLKTIRGRDGPNQDTPAIAITADVVTGTRASCLAQGFVEHATKPIRADELLAVIGRAAKAAPKKTAPKRSVRRA